jgi:hypothetical protein
MPPATYPNQITFYKITQEQALDLENIGRMLTSCNTDGYENPFMSSLAISFTESIEKNLEDSDNAECEISMDGADCYGNPRPYDTTDLEWSFRFTLCQEPYIALAVWHNNSQIHDLKEFMASLARHPYFVEVGNDGFFAVVGLLDDAITDAQSGAVTAILRSYYVYK